MRFDPRFPPPFFDTYRTPLGSPARRRTDARNDAAAAVDALAKAFAALRSDSREHELDLHLEIVRRRMTRVRAALDDFDAALAAPGGPPPPTPAHHPI
ncbi:hypothetical protein [Cellulomonas timonensis]|uniref:hypothetical protein n=1 Tax=Cellulomonas timonensis TaxID=1689271 RepID=UPI00131D7F60|nr:hypothetical protein [Cellulomonas timonensis]